MDKKESLEIFGGDVEQFEKDEAVREEAAEAFKEVQEFTNSLVSLWFDNSARFAIGATSRLYNAEDIAAFNIPVLEPGHNCKATPGFLPKMKASEFNKAIREAGSDLAIPIFADNDCKEDCLGFVICRGGEKFEILDSNAFGENEYSKDELFGAFKHAMIKGSFINKARSSGAMDLGGDYLSKFNKLFLDEKFYSEEQRETLRLVRARLSV